MTLQTVVKNADGLTLAYGTQKAVNANAGEYRTLGQLREIETVITLTDLTTSPLIVDNNLKFPTGVIIQEIVLVGEVAATSSGSATLDIGLQKEDRSTELDYNGLVAALAKTAYDAVGEQNTITAGGTGAGALLGTATTDVGYLTANANTAVFTAGKVRVRIRYYANTPITQ